MNNQFDELAKGLAQSVTRREMVRKLGGAMVGTFAACLGLGKVSAASGQKRRGVCTTTWGFPGVPPTYTGICIDPTTCTSGFSHDCPSGHRPEQGQILNACGAPPVGNKTCYF